jgi:hypothetical protein
MNWKRIARAVIGGGKTLAGAAVILQPIWGPFLGLPPADPATAIGIGSAIAGAGLAHKLANLLFADTDGDGKPDTVRGAFGTLGKRGK